MNKEVRGLVKALQAQGWRLRETKDAIVAMHPTGSDPLLYPAVNIHRTPSDRRALKNAIAILKRQGFVWPPPRKAR